MVWTSGVQFGTLARKNATLSLRNWKGTVGQLFSPVAICLMLLGQSSLLLSSLSLSLSLSVSLSLSLSPSLCLFLHFSLFVSLSLSLSLCLSLYLCLSAFLSPLYLSCV